LWGKHNHSWLLPITWWQGCHHQLTSIHDHWKSSIGESLGRNSPMWSNYLGSVLTPVSTSHLWCKLSASRLSGNCHTEIGVCQ
jgi:hypothetical protein